MAGLVSGGAPGPVLAFTWLVDKPRADRRFSGWACLRFGERGGSQTTAGGKGKARELMDETESGRLSDEETKGAHVEKADSTLTFGLIKEL